ncbi:HTH domain-containing protein [Bacillus cereus]|uniref:helix-turn-helix domain-containing protein n=1 Tax=Bacillus cereus TaxID=1396 RepID=UPI0018F487FA|nr:HTH domain-containing protein [Bacillus cereus]
MNKLVLNLIHNKSTIRKLHILERLSTEEGLITSKELAKQLNCSNRTIVNEISELKNNLPENWDIIAMKAKGYMLQKPPTESLSRIIMSHLQESTIYRILIETFNNNYYTLEKWSQISYTNKLTLKSNLKQFKAVLKENNLKFKFEPVELEGEEINIRYFYKALFFNIEQCVPMISLPDDLMRKIKDILNYYNVEIDNILLKVMIYVSIQRIISKNFMDKKIKLNIIFNPDQLTCFNRIISGIEDYSMVKLSKNEKDALNLFFFYITAGNTQQKIDILKYHEYENGEHYQKFLELVDMIISTNEGYPIEYDYLKLELYFYFYKLYSSKYYNFPLEYFFTRPNYLSHRLQGLYDTNCRIISKWNEAVNRSNFNEYEISQLAQHLTYIMCSVYPKKNVLFSFFGDNIHERMAYTTLKDNFGDSVDIHRKPEDKTKYDLIITNYKDSYPTKTPVLFIYQKFDQRDIESINHVLFNYNSC